MSKHQEFFWVKTSISHLAQPRTPQPKSHLNNNTFMSCQTQPRRVQTTTYPASHSHTQEEKLIQSLLQALGYCNTLEAFQRENRKKVGQSNPQDSGKKMTTKPSPSSNFQETVHQIILESKNFQQMLQYLEQALKRQQEEPMQQQNPGSELPKTSRFRTLQQYEDLQVRIKQLFSRKQKVLLPIFCMMQVDLDGKQVKLAAISAQGNVCILDNDHYLHVIRVEEGKSISVKIDSKIHPNELKWVNSDLILFLSSHTVYFYQAKNLKVQLSLRTDEEQAHCHEVVILERNFETYIYILTFIHHKFIIRRLISKHSMLNVLPKIVFNQVQQLKYITVLFAPLVSQQQMVAESDLERDQTTTRYEQYYGLAHNQRTIIKFDTMIEKAGIFWKSSSHFKIEELTASECRLFLLLVLSPQTHKDVQGEEDRCHENSLQYQIVKMNTKGCIVQKIKYRLDCRDMPLGFFELQDRGSYISKILNISHKMNPLWLRCFRWSNQIYYFSLKSARIVYKYVTDFKEQQIKVHSTSPSNAVLYSTKRHLILISTINAQPKKIQVDWHKRQSERQTMIQRLSRLQGIPENLLLILRSIRNNDIEIMELP